MATKTLNTRIQLKYDLYTNWIKNDPVLLKGEIALATIESGTTETVNSITIPQILIKVGDGVTTYTKLPFASGLAADVYSWAKNKELLASDVPELAQSKITNLTSDLAAINQAIVSLQDKDSSLDDKIDKIDTDTQYKLVQDDNDKYTLRLMSKSKTAETYATEVAKITIPNNDEDLEAFKEIYSGDIDSLNTRLLNLDDNIYAVKETAGANKLAIQTLVGSEVGDDKKSAREIAAEEVANIVADAPEAYDTLKEIADWISSHSNSAATMNSKIETAKNQLTGIEETEGAVKSYVDTSIENLHIENYAKAADLTNVAEQLDGFMNTTDYVSVSEISTAIKEVKTSIDDLDDSLAAIAKTGNVNDLVQHSNDYLVFYCGDSTTVY